jgi:hypothetical protein
VSECDGVSTGDAVTVGSGDLEAVSAGETVAEGSGVLAGETVAV